MGLANANCRLLTNKNARRFVYERKAENVRFFVPGSGRAAAVADRVGPGTDGQARGTVRPRGDSRRDRRRLFSRPVFRHDRHRAGPDGGGAGPVLLSDPVPRRRALLGRTGTLPRPQHRDKPQGDLRGSRRDPEAVHGKADPDAPRRGSGREFRGAEKHPDRADRLHRDDPCPHRAGVHGKPAPARVHPCLYLHRGLADGAGVPCDRSPRDVLLYLHDGDERAVLRAHGGGDESPERHGGGIHRRDPGHQGLRQDEKLLRPVREGRL